MAQSHVGNTHSSASHAVTVPPPSSLCPRCQQVEADAKQYKLDDGRDQIRYACDDEHEWRVTWPALGSEWVS